MNYKRFEISSCVSLVFYLLLLKFAPVSWWCFLLVCEMFAHNGGLSKGGDDGVRDLTHFWNVDLLQLLLIFYCPATFFSLKTAILWMEAECSISKSKIIVTIIVSTIITIYLWIEHQNNHLQRFIQWLVMSSEGGNREDMKVGRWWNQYENDDNDDASIISMEW